MRAFLSRLLAVLAVATAPWFARSAIVEHPVHCATGKSGSTITGSLTGDPTVDETLRVAAWQVMTVKPSSGSGVHFNLLPPRSTGEALFVGSRDGNMIFSAIKNG